MFARQPSRRDLQAENESLREALEQAKALLAEFRLREHDLADVLVRARGEARDLVEGARTEAHDVVERARTEAHALAESAGTEAHDVVERARMEARGLVDRATDEARQLRDAAQSEVDATLAEIGNAERQLLRLRGVQRELEGSLQQSLAALAPVLSLAAEALPRPTARDSAADTRATVDAPMPLAPVPVPAAPVPPLPEAHVRETPLAVSTAPVAPMTVPAAPLSPVPEAAVPPAPVPRAAVPAGPVPVAPQAVAPVPVAPVRLVAADPVRPPEMKSTGALEIFPLELALRPFERRPHRPRVAEPQARKWLVRLPRRGRVATVVAAGTVMGIAAVAWSTWGARERTDQTDAATMLSASAASSSAPALRAGETPGVGGNPATLATRSDTPPSRTLGRSPSGLFTVVVEAVRPVWLRADTDGKREVARTVLAGERVELHAAHEVTLRAGDAGALLTSVNGGAKALLGDDGAVITRRIAAPASAGTPRPGAPPGTQQRLLGAAARREPAGDTSGSLPAPAAATPAAAVQRTGARPPRAPGSLDPSLAVPDIPLSTSPAGPALASPGPRTAPSGTEPPSTGNAASSPAPASPLTPAETEVFGAHETYFDALRRADDAGMRRVMAPNFTATGVPAPVGTDSLAVNSISVQVSGVGAVVSGVASRRDAGADGRTTQLLFSEVWTNADGQWQLLSVRFIEAPRK
jgi:cell division septum initiation protein DivIVA